MGGQSVMCDMEWKRSNVDEVALGPRRSRRHHLASSNRSLGHDQEQTVEQRSESGWGGGLCGRGHCATGEFDGWLDALWPDDFHDSSACHPAPPKGTIPARRSSDTVQCNCSANCCSTFAFMAAMKGFSAF